MTHLYYPSPQATKYVGSEAKDFNVTLLNLQNKNKPERDSHAYKEVGRKSLWEWLGRTVEDGFVPSMAGSHLPSFMKVSAATVLKPEVSCCQVIYSKGTGYKSVSFVLRSGFHAAD